MFFSSSDSQSNEEALQIGQLLRQSREAHNGTIDEAAEDLRIDPFILVALESGQLNDLPGWARSISALRSYADYLELDASPLVVRFRKLMAEPAPGYTASLSRTPSRPEPVVQAPQPAPPPPSAAAPAPRQKAAKAPRSRHRIPTGLVFAVTLFAGIAVIAGWYLASGPAEDTDQQPVSSKLKEMLDRTIGLAQEDGAEPGPNQSLRTKTKPLPGLNGGDAAASRTTVMAKSSPQPATAAESPKNLPGNVVSIKPLDRLTMSREAAVQRLTLRARDQVWVRIADGSGQSIKTWEMKPGEMYLIPDQKDLILEARDAGAIELYRDGKLLGALGKAGDSVTNMKLDALLAAGSGG